MQPNRIIIISVVALVLVALGFYGLTANMTTGEERIAALEENFQAELENATDENETASDDQTVSSDEMVTSTQDSEGVDVNDSDEENTTNTATDESTENVSETGSDDGNEESPGGQTTTSEMSGDSDTVAAGMGENTETLDSEDTTPDDVQIFETTSTPGAGDETGSNGEAVVKDEWVQAEIDAHIDEIDEADLLIGSEIYNKLDTLYLLDMAEDGLTAEEEEEVKAYLEKELTPEEVTTAWELYVKYVHLLE